MLRSLRHSLTVLAPAATLLGGLGLLACTPGGKADVPPGSHVPDSHVSDSHVSGSHTSAHASAPSPAPQPDTRPVLVCFGDSLTAGLGVDPGESYPDVLQHLLDHDGYSYRVVNIGMSGATTKDGVNRIPAVTSLHPVVTVVEFGGNDGLQGLPVDQAQANLNTIVATLRQTGSKVALAGITIPPQYGGDYVNRFNAMFPAVAHRNHVPFIPFVLQGAYGVQGSMQADGIHATSTGNQQVARNVETLIQPLLHRSN